MRAAGLYGVHLVEIVASFASGVCFLSERAIAKRFDLDTDREARGTWSGFRDALVRLVRAGVFVRYSTDRATGGGSGRSLRVLAFGVPVEGGAELRRPSWVDDRGAAIELPRPGGACAGVRVLRVGVDLVEVPAPAPRKRKPATSRATETTSFDTSDVPILTRPTCPQSQTLTQTPLQGSATASGADPVATLHNPEPATLAAISTTAIMPTAEPAPDVPRGDTESAHEAGHVFALDAESPTIAPIESGASSDPTVGASPDLSNGANVERKSRRSKAPKSPRPKRAPKVDARTPAQKALAAGQGAMIQMMRNAWASRRSHLPMFSTHGEAGRAARNIAAALWSRNADPEHWREVVAERIARKGLDYFLRDIDEIATAAHRADVERHRVAAIEATTRAQIAEIESTSTAADIDPNPGNAFAERVKRAKLARLKERPTLAMTEGE